MSFGLSSKLMYGIAPRGLLGGVVVIANDILSNNVPAAPFVANSPTDPYTYDTGAVDHYAQFNTTANPDGDVSYKVFTHYIDANNNVYYHFDVGNIHLRATTGGVTQDIALGGGLGFVRPPGTTHRIESMNGFHKIFVAGIEQTTITRANTHPDIVSKTSSTVMLIDWMYNPIPTAYTFGTAAGTFAIAGGSYLTTTNKAQFVAEYINQPTGFEVSVNGGAYARATLVSNPVAGRAVYQSPALPAGKVTIAARQLDIPANSGTFTAYSNVAQHLYGINASGGSNQITNVYRDAPWLEGYQDMPFPYQTTTGQMSAFPPSGKIPRLPIPYCGPPGTTKWFRVEFSGTYTSGAAGTIRLEQTGVLITNFTYVATGVEFQFATPDPIPSNSNTENFLQIHTTGWAASFAVGQFYEITGAGGTRVQPQLIESDYVTKFQAANYHKITRFMTQSSVNGITHKSNVTGELTWAERNQGPRIPYSRALLVQGTGNSGIQFMTPPYTYDNATVAAMLPNHAFGTYGNNVRWQSVIGAGALSVSRTGYDITITQAVGGSTVDAVIASIDLPANIGVATVSHAIRAEGSLGTGLCPVFGFTNMAGGYDGFGDEHDLEAIVAKCNAMGSKPWITPPINATSEYITQTCNYLNTNLNAVCKPFYMESGNELWNLAFAACGWTISWAIKNGRVGPSPLEYSMQEAAEREKMQFTAAKAAVGANVICVIGVQSDNQTTFNIRRASAGYIAAYDAAAAGPYFYPDGGSYVGIATDAAYYANCRTSINTVLNNFGTTKAIADGDGKQMLIYEFGHHDTGPNLADNQRRQRSSEMKQIYGEYLNECRRRHGVGVTVVAAHYADFSGIATGNDGAWGLEETLGAAGSPPKLTAYKDAMIGVFPAYVDVTQSMTIPMTGTKTVGQILTIPVPVLRNVGTASLQLLRNGTAFGAPFPLIAAEVKQEYKYTQVAGDATTIVNFRLVLTNPQGASPVFVYQTANITATA